MVTVAVRTYNIMLRCDAREWQIELVTNKPVYHYLTITHPHWRQ